MSYNYSFLDSMKIDGKWGYNLLLSLYADTAVRGRLDLSMTDSGILTVNTVTSFLADNADETYKVFIEASEDGLSVPFSVEDMELTAPTPIMAASENDKVVFSDSGNVGLATATMQIQTLSFNVAGEVEPIKWSIDARRRWISLITPDVPLQCTSSFLSKLDLSPILSQRLRGRYVISDLLAMGATAEYITFPVVNAHTYVVDY